MVEIVVVQLVNNSDEEIWKTKITMEHQWV